MNDYHLLQINIECRLLKVSLLYCIVPPPYSLIIVLLTIQLLNMNEEFFVRNHNEIMRLCVQIALISTRIEFLINL